MIEESVPPQPFHRQRRRHFSLSADCIDYAMKFLRNSIFSRSSRLPAAAVFYSGPKRRINIYIDYRGKKINRKWKSFSFDLNSVEHFLFRKRRRLFTILRFRIAALGKHLVSSNPTASNGAKISLYYFILFRFNVRCTCINNEVSPTDKRSIFHLLRARSARRKGRGRKSMPKDGEEKWGQQNMEKDSLSIQKTLASSNNCYYLTLFSFRFNGSENICENVSKIISDARVSLCTFRSVSFFSLQYTNGTNVPSLFLWHIDKWSAGREKEEITRALRRVEIRNNEESRMYNRNESFARFLCFRLLCIGGA